MTKIVNEEEHQILQEYVQLILNTVDVNGSNYKKSRESFKENTHDFEHKFKLYEDEIENLRGKIMQFQQIKSVNEDKIAQLNQDLNNERHLTQTLMKNINDVNESCQIELRNNKESMKSTLFNEIQSRENLIISLKRQISDFQQKENEWSDCRLKLQSQLNAFEISISDFNLHYVKREDYERVVSEKLRKEDELYGIENQLAIETTKILTYESQNEKIKNQLKISAEKEAKMQLQIEELNSKLVAVNNEVKMMTGKRKSSMNNYDEPRVSGQLEIDESVLQSMYFSKVEDEVGRKIEEMEKEHQECQNQLKLKIKELIKSNEAIHNELMRLKEERQNFKNESSILKKSSVICSQKEILKIKKQDFSEEVVEKMMNYEHQNKKLREENLGLHKTLKDTIKKMMNYSALVYTCSVDYLK